MKSWIKAPLAIAAAGFALSAEAQTASVTVGPNGELRGSATAGQAPPVSVQAGGGVASSVIGPAPPEIAPGRTVRCPDRRSVTVRSADGSATSSAWSSGDSAVVAGAGSPGARVTTDTCPPRIATIPRSGKSPVRPRAHKHRNTHR